MNGQPKWHFCLILGEFHVFFFQQLGLKYEKKYKGYNSRIYFLETSEMISTYGNLRSKIKSSKANRNAINAKTVKASKQFVLKNLALKKISEVSRKMK